MASSAASAAPPQPDRTARRPVGPIVVAGIVFLALVGTWAIAHDAATTSPVISVPAATAVARPRDAAAAARAVERFVPSGSELSVGQAIAAATLRPQSAWRVRTTALGGGGFAVAIAVRPDVAALLRSGRIFTGGGQGSSDLARGLIAVTSGQTTYVLRMDPRDGVAQFLFRLSASGASLSAMNWNANSVVSQTPVGDNLP
jgi:hypothetical protein